MINTFVYSFSLEWDRLFESSSYANHFQPTRQDFSLSCAASLCRAGPGDSEMTEARSAPHRLLDVALEGQGLVAAGTQEEKR